MSLGVTRAILSHPSVNQFLIASTNRQVSSQIFVQNFNLTGIRDGIALHSNALGVVCEGRRSSINNIGGLSFFSVIVTHVHGSEGLNHTVSFGARPGYLDSRVSVSLELAVVSSKTSLCRKISPVVAKRTILVSLVRRINIMDHRRGSIV